MDESQIYGFSFLFLEIRVAKGFVLCAMCIVVSLTLFPLLCQYSLKRWSIAYGMKCLLFQFIEFRMYEFNRSRLYNHFKSLRSVPGCLHCWLVDVHAHYFTVNMVFHLLFHSICFLFFFCWWSICNSHFYWWGIWVVGIELGEYL